MALKRGPIARITMPNRPPPGSAARDLGYLVFVETAIVGWWGHFKTAVCVVSHREIDVSVMVDRATKLQPVRSWCTIDCHV